ncbi:MAG: hypothetical protein ABH885_07130 [Candidatus Omnitrophota bacterium]
MNGFGFLALVLGVMLICGAGVSQDVQDDVSSAGLPDGDMDVDQTAEGIGRDFSARALQLLTSRNRQPSAAVDAYQRLSNDEVLSLDASEEYPDLDNHGRFAARIAKALLTGGLDLNDTRNLMTRAASEYADVFESMVKGASGEEAAHGFIMKIKDLMQRDKVNSDVQSDVVSICGDYFRTLGDNLDTINS